MEECQPVNNHSIDNVFYAGFFVNVLPVTYLCYVFYHHFLLKKALGEDFNTIAIKSKFIGNTTNFILLLQGVTVSTMITAVLVTMYMIKTYDTCDEVSGVHGGILFVWPVGLISYCVIWYSDIKNNYTHVLKPDDSLKDKLNTLRKKYFRFMMYKSYNMAIAAMFITPAYYSVVITEDGEHIGCICYLEEANDIIALCFIITIYFFFTPFLLCFCPCLKDCWSGYLSQLVFLFTIFCVIYRFSIYENKINDLTRMGLQYHFDSGDLLMFWVTAMTLLFIVIHIVKCCKMNQEHAEDDDNDIEVNDPSVVMPSSYLASLSTGVYGQYTIPFEMQQSPINIITATPVSNGNEAINDEEFQSNQLQFNYTTALSAVVVTNDTK